MGTTSISNQATHDGELVVRGERGLATLRATLENMRVPVADVDLSLANTSDKLIDGRLTDTGAATQLDLVVASPIEGHARAA